jgi:Ni,Fe-hydrogenase III small subunit
VTDRTQQPSRRKLFAEPEHKIVLGVGTGLVIIGIFVGGYIYGQFLSSRDLGGRDTVIEQLRSENQKLKRGNDDAQAQITNLEAKLKSTQATLEAILPAANTYNIAPNQTLLVADGRITVGLIGSPANEGVQLKINGKLQTVSAGQVIPVDVPGSSNCQVTLQSFDMFKAALNATCAKK